MSYKQIKLFVKPSSSFPYEGINNYFVNYLNGLQDKSEDFLIGDMFNARDNELWALFSDKTKIAHGMHKNAMNILLAKQLNDDIANLKSEAQKPLDFTDSQFDEIKNASIVSLQAQMPVQQLYNDIKAAVTKDLHGRLEQMQDACGYFLATHLVGDSNFLDKTAQIIADKYTLLDK